MKQLLILLLAGMLCLCTACSEEQDPVPDSETTAVPTETVSTEWLTETTSVTEETTEADTEIPHLPDATEAWFRYDTRIYDEYNLAEVPYYDNLKLKGAKWSVMKSMVGGIEQRFFERTPVTQTLIDQICAAASGMLGEKITPEDLYCNLQNGRSDALSKVKDYNNIQTLYRGDCVEYDTSERTLKLWTSLHEKETESEETILYAQTFEEMTPYVPIEYHLADGTFAEEDISRWALDVFGSYEEESEAWLRPFLPVGYEVSLYSTTVRSFTDGTQGIYYHYGLYSRDIPVISDTGSPLDGKDREIAGTILTVGVLQSGRIDYFESCYIHADAPDSVILTDPREYMEGLTLISYEDACALVDEALSMPRTVESIRLQYAAIMLYDENDAVSGYVLTPIWHFLFADIQDDGQVFCMDADAVTGEIYSRYCSKYQDFYFTHPVE